MHDPTYRESMFDLVSNKARNLKKVVFVQSTDGSNQNSDLLI